MNDNKFKVKSKFFHEISIGKVILWMILSLILFVLSFYLRLKLSTGGVVVNNFAYGVLSIIAFYIVPLLGFIYMYKKLKCSKSDFNLEILKEINYKEVFIDILCMYIFTISSIFAFCIIMKNTNIKFFKWYVDWFNCIPSKSIYPINNIWIVIQNLLIVTLVPIIEEFIFRGVLLHRLNLRFGIVKSILIVSILFGFCHLQVLGACVSSIIMCIIYIRTKSIIVPIVYHAGNNLLAISARIIPNNILDKVHKIPEKTMIICGFSIFTIWLIYFIRREKAYYGENRGSRKEEIEEREKPVES